jgi:hypothetical protein
LALRQEPLDALAQRDIAGAFAVEEGGPLAARFLGGEGGQGFFAGAVHRSSIAGDCGRARDGSTSCGCTGMLAGL